MKYVLRFTPLLLLFVVLTSCLEEKCESEVAYIVYEPVYLEEDAFRKEIVATEARELCTPAGFYVYGDYLLVVEYDEGLHIMDNSDVANPIPVSFLPVGGAVGLSVRNNILYVNNYVDLVTFDLGDVENPAMLGRTEYAFDSYGVFNANLGYSRVVVEYIETSATQTVPCGSSYYGYGCYFEDDILLAQQGIFPTRRVDASLAFASANEANFGSAGFAGGQDDFVGVGGSLARFTITNQTLYTVNESSLKAFSLEDPANPLLTGTVQLNWGVETIFPGGDELYIGTNSGMHIMDASDPLNPQWLSTMQHVRACDPVVVSGDRAYVTLKGGDECGGFTNQLDVVDISNKRAPQLIRSITLQGPVGLTAGNDRLFICEPGFGMSIFPLDESGMPVEDQQIMLPELGNARDVIGLHARRHLLLIGQNGIEQLRYDELGETLESLSLIEVCP